MDAMGFPPLWRRRGIRVMCLLAGAASLAACAGTPAAHPAASASGASSTAAPSPAPTPTRPHSATTVAHARSGCLSVPILVYHYIRLVTSKANLLGYDLSVSPVEFASQMDWLKRAGGHPVTLSQVLQAMAGGTPLPPHPIVLTFDDGYDDFATAATPVLLRDGFVGTDFVVSGFVGRPGYMTAQQVQQVA